MYESVYEKKHTEASSPPEGVNIFPNKEPSNAHPNLEKVKFVNKHF